MIRYGDLRTVASREKLSDDYRPGSGFRRNGIACCWIQDERTTSWAPKRCATLLCITIDHSCEWLTMSASNGYKNTNKHCSELHIGYILKLE